MEDREKEKNLVKYLIDGTYTKEEAKNALKFLRDQDNDEVIDKQMIEVWKNIIGSQDSGTFTYNYDKQRADSLLRQINKKTSYKKYIKYGIAAASIILLIGIGLIGNKYFSQTEEENIFYTEIYTAHSQTREIVLSDGTVVVLNACSHLSYPEKFKGSERIIKLEGEAYFRVTKNAQQPFIINTRKFDVQVLGTSFNVKAYDGDEIQTINVESGKVRVDMPEAMSQLSRNEQIEINTKSNGYTKEKSKYNDVAIWRTGSLLFNKTPITDVAKQLERVYNCKIVFDDNQHFDNIISGIHDNKNLEEVLVSIGLTSGIKWKLNKEKGIIVLHK